MREITQNAQNGKMKDTCSTESVVRRLHGLSRHQKLYRVKVRGEMFQIKNISGGGNLAFLIHLISDENLSIILYLKLKIVVFKVLL